MKPGARKFPRRRSNSLPWCTSFQAMISLHGLTAYVARVASVSARVRRESWAKKKEWRGRGRGRKETLARKPHDFEKLRSPTNAASDWCGAGSVDYLALETSIKPGMLCLRASQIWSHLIDTVRRASWGKNQTRLICIWPSLTSLVTP